MSRMPSSSLLRRAVVPAVALLAGAALLPARAATTDDVAVTVTRTAHGVAHIEADDYDDLGYGYGYAIAEDNVCILADTYATVRAERSRWFGPDAGYVFEGNGASVDNLDSDFFFQRIIDDRVVERLLDQPPPHGPRPEVRAIARGYAAGWNRYLADVGVDHLPDPGCRGKGWVRPISEIDVFRRFYQLLLIASQGVAINEIGSAQPPGPSLPVPGTAATTAPAPDRVAALLRDRWRPPIGSNAVALGRDATSHSGGMLLGNPHFPWQGSERFWQAHLRIPGKLDVAGASLLGVPLVLIGHTATMGWSHTVSTAFRFTPFELRLVPGSPTTYLVDGEPRAMTPHPVTVTVRTSGGALEQRSRTLWSTEYGPVMTGVLGLPVFPWTPATAWAMGDANATNFRVLNHFFETNHARSVRDLHRIVTRYQSVPWVNTIAADRSGEAYYADVSVVPNVPDDHAAACNTPVGRATFEALRLPVLDGSRSACRWRDDPDAVVPGIFGPSNLPSLFRTDYVTNSNDSYWLANPDQPLEGYARIIGDEGTERSLRTRSGLVMVDERVGRGRRFDLGDLQKLAFSNRQHAGELVRDDLVSMCEALPGGLAPSSSGPVDVSEACPVLAAWDLRDDLDSAGAILFRRFWTRADDTAPDPWARGFDAADPVRTPAGLDTTHPQVRQALGDAVQDLRNAGIPLDAGLRGWQSERRGSRAVPVHGGPGTLGVFNAINVSWRADAGYPDVSHGSSFVMAAAFDGDCAKVRTILTYSQSANPASPWYADQTELFARKRWVTPPFCPGQLEAAPKLQVTHLR